jgi:type 1 glutamine amidotransferase
MKHLLKYLLLLFCFTTYLSCKAYYASPKSKKILVFSLTKGFHHASIADGLVAMKKMASENNLVMDTTTNVEAFTTENLKQYQSLVFLNPTGSNVFSDSQKQALKQYLNNGGGFVGIHAATDFCYEWEWYGKMVGAYFEKHPKIQNAKLNIIEPKNKLVKGLPQPWMHTDEWYNFKNVNPDLKVVIQVDETSYTGGTMKNNHPISWYHNFEGGKVFYTALGHTKECYTDPLFLSHVLAGLKWSLN